MRSHRLVFLFLAMAVLAGLGPAQEATVEAKDRQNSPDQLLVVRIQRGSVAFLDLATGAITLDIALGKGPHEIAVDPSGKVAAIPEYGGSRLFLIDIAARKLKRSIPLRRAGRTRVDGQPMPFYRPHGLCWLADGQMVLVTAELQQSLLAVDVAIGAVAAAWSTDQAMSHMVLVANERAWVANKTDGTVSIFDLGAKAGRRLKTLPTGRGAQGMAVHPTTGEIWVGNIFANSISVLDPETMVEVEEFACGTYPVRIAFTPDGSHALVSNYQPGTVSVFDAKARKSVAEIGLPGLSAAEAKTRPLPPQRQGFDATTPLPVGLLVAPRGDVAYVSCTRSDRVHEIDLATREIRRSFTVIGEPDGLAFVPGRSP